MATENVWYHLCHCLLSPLPLYFIYRIAGCKICLSIQYDTIRKQEYCITCIYYLHYLFTVRITRWILCEPVNKCYPVLGYASSCSVSNVTQPEGIADFITRKKCKVILLKCDVEIWDAKIPNGSSRRRMLRNAKMVFLGTLFVRLIGEFFKRNNLTIVDHLKVVSVKQGEEITWEEKNYRPLGHLKMSVFFRCTSRLYGLFFD